MRYDLDYANVIDNETLENNNIKVLKYLSNILKSTLGPFGNNTIIDDKYLNHEITKDGFTVYSYLRFYKKLPNVISTIVKKVSSAINESSGDGTTSAMIITNELYKLRLLMKKYNISPKIISGIIEIISEYVVEELKKLSVNITKINIDKEKYFNVIKNAAAISCNNDYELGTQIAKLYSSLADPINGFVHIEYSKDEKTKFDTERGFEIYRGLALPELCTEPDNYTAIVEDARCIALDGHLISTDINNFIDFINASLPTPVVVIAGGYSRDFLELLRRAVIDHKEKTGESLKLICTTVDTDSELGKEGFLDICMCVGANPIRIEKDKGFPSRSLDDQQRLLKSIGHVKKCISNGRLTRLIGGRRNEVQINARVASLQERIEKLQAILAEDNSEQIYALRKRIAVLNNDMVTLYVGGATYDEKKSKSFLLQDATQSCRSGLEHGFIYGGNLAVSKIIHKIFNNNKKWYESYKTVVKKSDLYKKIIVDVKDRFGVFDDNLILNLTYDILKIIYTSYKNAYAAILNNKYKNNYKSLKIVNKCLKTGTIFNLVTEKYEKDDPLECKVINSVETDIKILKASTSIINLLITSNQFIRIPEIDKIREDIY